MEKNTVLDDSIEKILLDPESLAAIKKAIDNVSKGLMTPREFRKMYFENRSIEIKKLNRLFQFYNKQSIKLQSIQGFTQSSSNPQLEKELQERNQFFEQVGLRVKTIYGKLRNLQEANVITR